MKVLVTGGKGLLASALLPALEAAGHSGIPVDVEDGDVEDRRFLETTLEEIRPDWVAHLAAMTAVDRAETEPEETFRVNVEGTRAVAETAARRGIPVLLLSTDYVFDGGSGTPYRESDPVAPLGIYGKSKALAEEALREAGDAWGVVRSAWLYGPGGSNFVDTILGRLERGETCRVVDDQRGSPTYTRDLASGLVALMAAGLRGTVHLVNGGEASWFELARAAAGLAGFDPARVEPAATGEIARPAPRPRYSVLDSSQARRRYGVALRPWPEALQDYVAARGDRAAGGTR